MVLRHISSNPRLLLGMVAGGTKVGGEEGDKDEGWLLVEMDAQWVGERRGVVTQRVWRGGDGRLIATCV